MQFSKPVFIFEAILTSYLSEDTNTTETTTMDDATLIKKAEEFYSEERLLKAAELLKQVQDKENLFTDHHKMILRWAKLVEDGIEKLLQDPEDGNNAWIKQKESHGHRDFMVFYQLTEENKLMARIDSAFEPSLLVPILSVFNESDLYSSWMPSWEKPFKLGVTKSDKLKQEGRGHQIIHVRTALTWPFAPRDLIMRALAVDAIEDGHSCIAIQALSQTSEDDPVIPEAEKGTVAMDFNNFFLIRACPPDHPCVTRSKNHSKDEEQILLSLAIEVDPHLGVVPQSMQNFATRTVLGRMWLALLQVAEDVREGKRPMHKEAIDAKRDLYDWVEERTSVMIKNMFEKETVIS